jgi:ATP-dependent DNA ligase
MVGYLRNRTGLNSLLIGYRHEGKLVYVGRVSSGLTMKLCNQLLPVLRQSGTPLSARAGAVWGRQLMRAWAIYCATKSKSAHVISNGAPSIDRKNAQGLGPYSFPGRLAFTRSSAHADTSLCIHPDERFDSFTGAGNSFLLIAS